MKVDGKIIKNGVELYIDDKNFRLEFPEEVWALYPQALKEIFINNYVFLKTIHLSQFIESAKNITFNTPNPMFKHAIFDCMLHNISFCADVDSISTAEEIKNFLNLDFKFNGISTEVLHYSETLKEKAVTSLSFGKDSLLSFGVADELGLKPEALISYDIDCPIENKYKKDIAQRFSKEFKANVWELYNNTSIIHRSMFWSNRKSEWGYGHLLTELLLNSLPFQNYLKTKYIVLGNEQSCNDYYVNKDGYKSYPVYDQSSEWMIELDRMVKVLTGNQGSVISLVEPIYELAITRILHKRYPKIGKHQMSCFPDDSEHGIRHHLCQHCSKCARIFIFLRANGIDPKSLGFTSNMLDLEFKNFYSIFGMGSGVAVGYDASGCGREEQMYAFYLAYKKGAKGKLMDVFKRKYLPLAKEREEDWRKTFFSVHPSKTLPTRLHKEVESIYKEELSF